jgi:hypothetical protein
MKRKPTAALILFAASLLFSGCAGTGTKKESLVPTDNIKQVDRQQQTLENEKSAPNQTNDLPTTIGETEKDLQVIDNDLKEIDKLDMTEEPIEL